MAEQASFVSLGRVQQGMPSESRSRGKITIMGLLRPHAGALWLGLFAIAGERSFFNVCKDGRRDTANDTTVLSAVWGIALVVIAGACIIWLPNVIGK